MKIEVKREFIVHALTARLLLLGKGSIQDAPEGAAFQLPGGGTIRLSHRKGVQDTMQMFEANGKPMSAEMPTDDAGAVAAMMLNADIAILRDDESLPASFFVLADDVASFISMGHVDTKTRVAALNRGEIGDAFLKEIAPWLPVLDEPVKRFEDDRSAGRTVKDLESSTYVHWFGWVDRLEHQSRGLSMEALELDGFAWRKVGTGIGAVVLETRIKGARMGGMSDRSVDRRAWDKTFYLENAAGEVELVAQIDDDGGIGIKGLPHWQDDEQGFDAMVQALRDWTSSAAPRP